MEIRESRASSGLAGNEDGCTVNHYVEGNRIIIENIDNLLCTRI